MQRKNKVRGLMGIAVSAAALLASATPAFAAGTIITPTPTPGANATPCPVGTSCPTFNVPPDASGNPLSFTVKATGYLGTTAIEICDGVSSSTPGYDPNAECDSSSSPATLVAHSTTDVLTWTGGDPNFGIIPFRGTSFTNKFNCLAPEDVKPGTKPNADGSVTPIGTTTVHGGDAITTDPGIKSWTNCQLRVANDLTTSGATDAYLTLSLPNTGSGGPPPSTPEAPLAVFLPIGAVALLGAGYLLNRKRRTNRPTA